MEMGKCHKSGIVCLFFVFLELHSKAQQNTHHRISMNLISGKERAIIRIGKACHKLMATDVSAFCSPVLSILHASHVKLYMNQA